jgi:aryl-alcohol dehydrogenase-like predicted oxidoreductase
MAVEGSLRRLRTDRSDLCYQHRVDRGTPIEGRHRLQRGLSHLLRRHRCGHGCRRVGHDGASRDNADRGQQGSGRQ